MNMGKVPDVYMGGCSVFFRGVCVYPVYARRQKLHAASLMVYLILISSFMLVGASFFMSRILLYSEKKNGALFSSGISSYCGKQ